MKMIFSIADHVEQIKNGSKTQTRRKSPAYLVGKTYSIQPHARAMRDNDVLVVITHINTINMVSLFVVYI